MTVPDESPNAGTEMMKEEAPRQPIWAPNPAVPPAARLLAYAFGVLMLVTVILSKVYLRPADLPQMPKQWLAYKTADLSLSYPEGWDVLESARKLEKYLPERTGLIKQTTFTLFPDDYIRITALTYDSSMSRGNLEMSKLIFLAEKILREEYTGYQAHQSVATGVPGETWHPFSGKMTDESRRPVTGAWLLRVEGSRALILAAVSSGEGWGTMSRIFSAVSASATLTAAPPIIIRHTAPDYPVPLESY